LRSVGAARSRPTTPSPRQRAGAIVERALDAFGTVDAVIHNAGVWRNVPYDAMTPDQLEPVLDVHLRGAFLVTQPAWAVMKEKRYGRIVLTSSSAGAFGRESGTSYVASKAAMLGLAGRWRWRARRSASRRTASFRSLRSVGEDQSPPSSLHRS
jgi:NAD(P)-dependent dehydrogenase (short-subunit alcohol dehydrogenase family)